MKIFDDIIAFIISLDARKFTTYLGLTLAAILLLTGSMSYYFYYKSADLVNSIKNLQKLSNEAKEIAYLYQTIQEKKQSVLDALAHEKDFELKSFFAAFCKENNLKPESNWIT